MAAAEAGATHLTRYSLGESQDAETTERSASFEVQPNNQFSKAFAKLVGNGPLGSTREAMPNELPDLADAEEGL